MKLLIITQKVDINDDILGFFHRWIEKIAPLVDELYVVANAVGDYNLPKNVSVFSLGKEKRYPRFLRYLIFYKHLLKILPKADEVFVHMCPEYVVAMHPINIFFRKPVIMWYAHVKVSKVAKSALEKVKYVLTPSKESFIFSSDKVIGTGHGIDLGIFKPMPKTKKTNKTEILSLSRISYVKDIDILLEAVNILVNKYSIEDFYVNIVGQPARPEDFSYLSTLKDKVKKYNIEDYIKWSGSVSNREASQVYNNADIFVRMQAGGGFGKTELEAMACGVPVVICTPVYNTLLGEFKDDVFWKEKDANDFAEKIMLVTPWSEDKKERYAKLSRYIVENNHNLDRLAEKIINCFKNNV